MDALEPTQIDLQSQRGATHRAYRVSVVAGPDVNMAGSELQLEGGTRALVGTSPVCALHLTDPRVSRRHLAFEVTSDGLRVTDLDSTNGTFVDGLRVYDALLRGEEIVRLGETNVRVEPILSQEPTEVSNATSFGRLIGASSEMRAIYPQLARLAASDVPVIIEGETGTGKEVLAEAIHEVGVRANGPFVVFDCTAVPRELVESELFGHERGAFTGAVSTRIGVFEQAQGGTLLIDEIGDLEPALQPKLLRVLERKMVRRVGGQRWIPLDVRVLSATRRDLDREIQDGRFRDDLFFRLAVARVELPPLRKRRGDVTTLARHLWKSFGGVGEPSYDLLRRLERYAWPGNVRELSNAVARHVALGDGAGILEVRTASQPPTPREDALGGILSQRLPYPRARDLALAEFERRYVEQVLEENGGNVTRAATASGIGRRYFTTLVGRLTR